MPTQYDLELMKELYEGWGFIISPSQKAINRAKILKKKKLLKNVYLHNDRLYGEVTKKGIRVLKEEDMI